MQGHLLFRRPLGPDTVRSVQEAIGARLFRRPLGPDTVRSSTSSGTSANGIGDQERAKVYHVHRRLASSAPPHCQRVSQPRRLDKSGPQGTGWAGGPLGSGLVCDIWTGAAWVSQGMAGRPCSGMAQPGGLRRPGFGPGWERFANPPPPLSLSPYQNPPVGDCANTGFPFPFRPQSDDPRAVPVVERVAQRPSYPSVRTGFLQGQATSPGWVRVSIAPCVPGGVANHSVHTPLLLSPHHLHYASNGGG